VVQCCNERAAAAGRHACSSEQASRQAQAAQLRRRTPATSNAAFEAPARVHCMLHARRRGERPTACCLEPSALRLSTVDVHGGAEWLGSIRLHDKQRTQAWLLRSERSARTHNPCCEI
jgi:hypothetical protein